jgi:DNA-binding HxlR family transcriptional regulator
VDEPRSGCPVNAALEVLGDRWSLIVLRDIMFNNVRHFRTLQRESEEGIASNILANRLRELVAAGLLTRDDAGAGRRATYSLTEAAIQLVPLLAELGWWGLRHRPTSAPLRVRAEALYDGGPEMWRNFMDELRELHLGVPKPDTGGPSVIERLDAVGAQAAANQPPRSNDGKKITSPTVM